MVAVLSACQNSKVDEVIKSGKFEEKIEIQVFPIFNCQSEVQNTVHAQRSRTLEQSVDVEFNLKIGLSAEVVYGEIGSAYGWKNNTSLTDSGGVELNAAPKSYPIYTIAWREQWEKGIVTVIDKDGKKQELP